MFKALLLLFFVINAKADIFPVYLDKCYTSNSSKYTELLQNEDGSLNLISYNDFKIESYKQILWASETQESLYKISSVSNYFFKKAKLGEVDFTIYLDKPFKPQRLFIYAYKDDLYLNYYSMICHYNIL